jgi:hypothetical protein
MSEIEENHRAILAAPAPEPRFKAVPGSVSAHCCFEASVIDTTKPMTYSVGFDPICEAWSIEDAEKIADALNAVE